MINDDSIFSYVYSSSVYLLSWDTYSDFFAPLKKIGLFLFLCLSFKCFLNILDTSALSGKYFENIFPKFITYILIQQAPYLRTFRLWAFKEAKYVPMSSHVN